MNHKINCTCKTSAFISIYQWLMPRMYYYPKVENLVTVAPHILVFEKMIFLNLINSLCRMYTHLGYLCDLIR